MLHPYVGHTHIACHMNMSDDICICHAESLARQVNLMLRDPLDMILGTRTKVRLLRTLSFLDRPVTGREAARLAGVSHIAQQALTELAEMGVLDCTTTPSGHLYRINEENYLFSFLLGLFEAESKRFAELLDQLRELLGEHQGILGASFIGSAARGEETASSDLDLLIVVEDSELKAALSDSLIELEAGLPAEFGIRLSPVVLTRRELHRQEDDPESLVSKALPDARSIYGSPLDEIIRSQ